MKIIRRSAFLIALLAIAFSANGQLNFKKGWIVTAANDTVYGTINDAGGMRNSRVCVFKAIGENKIVKYAPEDLLSYRILGEKYYVSRKISHNYKTISCFLEVMMEGRINLYRYNVAAVYYIEKEGHELSILKNDIDLQERSRYIYPIKWDSYKLGTYVYKDTLYSFFRDCVPVLNELDMVEYNRESLISITKKYLRLTNQSGGDITYERNLKLARPKFGIYTGVQMSKLMFYDYLIDSRPTASVPVGILYNVPVTPISENISIQVGANFSHINYRDNLINSTSAFDDITVKSTSIGIPISLNYGLNFNKFTPFIGIGNELALVISSEATYKGQRYNEEGIINYGDIENLLHKVQKGGWFADLGFKYKVSPEFSFFTNLRFQHYYNLIIEDESVSNNTYKTAVGFWNTVQYETYLFCLHFGVMF